MQYRKLGKSGIEASAVGFGAWAIGGWMWGGTDERQSIRAIQQAIDESINLIDTAPVYGFGVSEEIVGKAIKDRRDKVVLATKCGLVWNREQGDFYFASDRNHPDKNGDRKVYRCLAPDSIRTEIELSLRRLQTDHIDLLQTHWQESTTPISETMQTLMELKQEGKIRAIGCSNATPQQMDEYRQAGDLDTDQERYSMLDRKHDTENLPYVAKHQIAFLAYSPLAQGLLTGKIGPERVFEEGDQRRKKERFSIENRQRIQELLTQFQPIAERHQITMTQLTIAWTIARHGCTHALVGARRPQQVTENAAAGSVKLTDDDMTHMQAVLDACDDGA